MYQTVSMVTTAPAFIRAFKFTLVMIIYVLFDIFFGFLSISIAPFPLFHKTSMTYILKNLSLTLVEVKKFLNSDNSVQTLFFIII